MNLAVPREAYPGEVRVALIPEHVARLVNAGADVMIESGLGQPLRIADEKYTEAGASVVADHNSSFKMPMWCCAFANPSQKKWSA